jgi:hypothetical protein
MIYVENHILSISASDRLQLLTPRCLSVFRPFCLSRISPPIFQLHRIFFFSLAASSCLFSVLRRRTTFPACMRIFFTAASVWTLFWLCLSQNYRQHTKRRFSTQPKSKNHNIWCDSLIVQDLERQALPVALCCWFGYVMRV